MSKHDPMMRSTNDPCFGRDLWVAGEFFFILADNSDENKHGGNLCVRLSVIELTPRILAEIWIWIADMEKAS